MIKTTNHNVVRFVPILSGSKNHKFRVDEWDVDFAISLVDLHQYRCFWFEKVYVHREKLHDRINIHTKVPKKSNIFFINAYVEAYEDVEVNDSMLAKRMKILGWSHVAKNISNKGYWVEQFHPGVDILVDLEGHETGV